MIHDLGVVNCEHPKKSTERCVIRGGGACLEIRRVTTALGNTYSVASIYYLPFLRRLSAIFDRR